MKSEERQWNADEGRGRNKCYGIRVPYSIKYCKGTKAQPIGRGVNGREKRLHTMAQIVWEAASIPGAE